MKILGKIMSGFHRGRPAQGLTRAAVSEQVAQFLCLEDISARANRERDPFNVADPCPVNPTGHQTIVSCGEVVCWHCARIFWR